MVAFKQLCSNSWNYHHYRLAIKIFLVFAFSFFLLIGLAGISLSFRNVVFKPLIQPAWRDVPTEDIVRMRYLNKRKPVDFEVEVVCEKTLNPDTDGFYNRCNAGEKRLISEQVALYDKDSNLTAAETQEMLRRGWGLFLPRLTSREKVEALRLLLLLTTALEQSQVSHFLTAGSLLGLTRHGGMIPWDDDIDVGVAWQHGTAARRALSCLHGFQLQLVRPFQWCFSSTRRPFPWIHVFLYDSDQRYAWALTPHITNTFVYLRANVHPLTTAAYEGCVAVPVPGHTARVVRRIYSYGRCRAEEKHRRVARVSGVAGVGDGGYRVEELPCSDLTRFYWMNLKEGVDETV